MDEDVVPDFNDAGAVAIDLADMPRNVLHVAKFRSEIVVDFGAGSAGTGFRHLPKIVFATAGKELGSHKAGLRQPDIAGFFVGRQFALFVGEISCV